jgi:hypothetical protein
MGISNPCAINLIDPVPPKGKYQNTDGRQVFVFPNADAEKTVEMYAVGKSPGSWDELGGILAWCARQSN